MSIVDTIQIGLSVDLSDALQSVDGLRKLLKRKPLELKVDTDALKSSIAAAVDASPLKLAIDSAHLQKAAEREIKAVSKAKYAVEVGVNIDKESATKQITGFLNKDRKLDIGVGLTGLSAAADKVKELTATRELSIKLSTASNSVITGLQATLKDIAERKISLSVATPDQKAVDKLAESINGINNKTINVDVNTTGADSIVTLKESLSTLKSKRIKLDVEAVNTEAIGTLTEALSTVKAKKLKLDLTTEGSENIDLILAGLAKLESKQIRISTVFDSDPPIEDVKKLLSTLKSKKVAIALETRNIEAIAEVTEALETLRARKVPVALSFDGTAEIDKAIKGIGALDSKTVKISTVFDSDPPIEDVKKLLSTLKSRTVTISIEARNIEAVAQVTEALESLRSRKVPVSLSFDGAAAVEDALKDIAALDSKVIKISTVFDSDPPIADVKALLATLKSKKIRVDIEPTNTDAIGPLVASLEGLTSRRVRVDVDVDAASGSSIASLSGVISEISTAVAKLDNKTINIKALLETEPPIEEFKKSLSSLRSRTLKIGAELSGSEAVSSQLSGLKGDSVTIPVRIDQADLNEQLAKLSASSTVEFVLKPAVAPGAIKSAIDAAMTGAGELPGIAVGVDQMKLEKALEAALKGASKDVTGSNPLALTVDQMKLDRALEKALKSGIKDATDVNLLALGVDQPKLSKAIEKALRASSKDAIDANPLTLKIDLAKPMQGLAEIEAKILEIDRKPIILEIQRTGLNAIEADIKALNNIVVKIDDTNAVAAITGIKERLDAINPYRIAVVVDSDGGSGLKEIAKVQEESKETVKRRELLARVEAANYKELQKIAKELSIAPNNGNSTADYKAMLSQFLAIEEAAERVSKAWRITGQKFDDIQDEMKAKAEHVGNAIWQAENHRAADRVREAWDRTEDSFLENQDSMQSRAERAGKAIRDALERAAKSGEFVIDVNAKQAKKDLADFSNYAKLTIGQKKRLEIEVESSNIAKALAAISEIKREFAKASQEQQDLMRNGVNQELAAQQDRINQSKKEIAAIKGRAREELDILEEQSKAYKVLIAERKALDDAEEVSSKQALKDRKEMEAALDGLVKDLDKIQKQSDATLQQNLKSLEKEFDQRRALQEKAAKDAAKIRNSERLSFEKDIEAAAKAVEAKTRVDEKSREKLQAEFDKIGKGLDDLILTNAAKARKAYDKELNAQLGAIDKLGKELQALRDKATKEADKAAKRAKAEMDAFEKQIAEINALADKRTEKDRTKEMNGLLDDARKSMNARLAENAKATAAAQKELDAKVKELNKLQAAHTKELAGEMKSFSKEIDELYRLVDKADAKIAKEIRETEQELAKLSTALGDYADKRAADAAKALQKAQEKADKEELKREEAKLKQQQKIQEQQAAHAAKLLKEQNDFAMDLAKLEQMFNERDAKIAERQAKAKKELDARYKRDFDADTEKMRNQLQKQIQKESDFRYKVLVDNDEVTRLRKQLAEIEDKKAILRVGVQDAEVDRVLRKLDKIQRSIEIDLKIKEGNASGADLAEKFGNAFKGKMGGIVGGLVGGIGGAIGGAIGNAAQEVAQQAIQLYQGAVSGIASVLKSSFAEFGAIEKSTKIAAQTLALRDPSANAELIKKQLFDAIQKTSLSSGNLFGGKEIGALAETLSRSGLGLGEIKSNLTGIATGATAANEDLVKFGTGFTDYINKFRDATKLPVQQFKDNKKMLEYYTIALTNANMSSENFAKFTQYINPLKQGAEAAKDAAIMATMLARVGAKGSRAATDLNSEYKNLGLALEGTTKLAERKREVLDKLTVTTYNNGSAVKKTLKEVIYEGGELKDYVTVMPALAASYTQAVKEMGKTKADTLFQDLLGTKGLQGLSNAVSTSVKDMESLKNQMDKAGENLDDFWNKLSDPDVSKRRGQLFADNFAKAMQGGITGALAQLENTRDAIYGAIGNALQPIATTLGIGLNLTLKNVMTVVGRSLGPQLDAITQKFAAIGQNSDIVDNLSIAFSRLGESIGSTLLSYLDRLADVLSDPAKLQVLTDGISFWVNGLIKSFAFVTDGIIKLGALATQVGQNVGAMFGGDVGGPAAVQNSRLSALVEHLGVVEQHIADIEALNEAYEQSKKYVEYLRASDLTTPDELAKAEAEYKRYGDEIAKTKTRLSELRAEQTKTNEAIANASKSTQSTEGKYGDPATLSASWSSATADLNKGFQELLQSFSPINEAFGRMIATLGPPFLSAIGGALGAIGRVIGLVSPFLGMLIDLATFGLAPVVAGVNAVIAAFNGLIRPLMGMSDGTKGLRGDFKILADTTREFFGGITVGRLTEAGAMVVDAWNWGLDTMGNKLTERLGFIVTTWKNGFDAMKERMVFLGANWKEGLDGMGLEFNARMSELGTNWKEGLDGMGLELKAGWQSYSTDWKEGVEGIKLTSSAGIENIKGTFSTGFDAIKLTWNQTVEGLKIIWNQGVEVIKLIWNQAVSSILSAWSQGIAAIKAAWNQAVTDIGAIWQRGMNFLITGVITLAKNIVSALGAAWNQISRQIQPVVNLISGPFNGAINAARNALAGIGDAIQRWLGPLGSALSTLRDIGNAISNNNSAAAAAPSGLGGSAAQTFSLGKIFGFAGGGVLPGYSKKDDQIIMARSGEGIIVPEAVKLLGGAEGVEKLNRMAERGALQKFAQGGVVSNVKATALIPPASITAPPTPTVAKPVPVTVVQKTTDAAAEQARSMAKAVEMVIDLLPKIHSALLAITQANTQLSGAVRAVSYPTTNTDYPGVTVEDVSPVAGSKIANGGAATKKTPNLTSFTSGEINGDALKRANDQFIKMAKAVQGITKSFPELQKALTNLIADIPTKGIAGSDVSITAVRDQLAKLSQNQMAAIKAAVAKTLPTGSVQGVAGSAGTMSAADIYKLLEGGSNSMIAKVIGMAEGNRTADGGYTRHAKGHVDPGNGAFNIGSFSAQGNLNDGTIEGSDRRVIERLLRPRVEKLVKAAAKAGIKITPEILLNYLDLANQAPLAADGDATGAGFLGQLSKLKGKESSQDAIATVRAESFRNYNGKLETTFASYNALLKDQQRRMAELADAQKAFKLTGSLSTVATAPPSEVTAAVETLFGNLRDGIETVGGTAVKSMADLIPLLPKEMQQIVRDVLDGKVTKVRADMADFLEGVTKEIQLSNELGASPIFNANAGNAGNIIVNRTGQFDENGLEKLLVRAFDKQGKVINAMIGVSGIRSTQGNFGHLARTVAGTNNPMPFGDYRIGETVNVEGRKGYGKFTTILSPKFSTAREGIEAHVDGNRTFSPGSAGCLVFKNEDEFQAFMKSVRDSGANNLRFEEAKLGTNIKLPENSTKGMAELKERQVDRKRVLDNLQATINSANKVNNAQKAVENLQSTQSFDDAIAALEAQKRTISNNKEAFKENARIKRQQLEVEQAQRAYDDEIAEQPKKRELMILNQKRAMDTLKGGKKTTPQQIADLQESQSRALAIFEEEQKQTRQRKKDRLEQAQTALENQIQIDAIDNRGDVLAEITELQKRLRNKEINEQEMEAALKRLGIAQINGQFQILESAESLLKATKDKAAADKRSQGEIEKLLRGQGLIFKDAMFEALELEYNFYRQKLDSNLSKASPEQLEFLRQKGLLQTGSITGSYVKGAPGPERDKYGGIILSQAQIDREEISRTYITAGAEAAKALADSKLQAVYEVTKAGYNPDSKAQRGKRLETLTTAPFVAPEDLRTAIAESNASRVQTAANLPTNSFVEGAPKFDLQGNQVGRIKIDLPAGLLGGSQQTDKIIRSTVGQIEDGLADPQLIKAIIPQILAILRSDPQVRQTVGYGG